MNNKIENFIILFDVAFAVLFFYLFIVRKIIFRYAEGPPLDIVLLTQALIITFIIFLIVFSSKPINRNNKRWIKVSAVILFIIWILFISYFTVRINDSYFARVLNYEGMCMSDSCLLSLAKARADEALCSKIKDGDKIEQCYWRVGQKTGNILLCSKAGKYEDICISTIDSKPNL